MERPATRKQLAYIRLLAKGVGASLYLGNIKTMEEASKTIDTLKKQREALYQAPKGQPNPRRFGW